MPFSIVPMPLKIVVKPSNIFFTSCTSPVNVAFIPDATAFIPGNSVLNTFIIPAAISGGKMFLMLFLKSCAALSQLPVNAPPKNSKIALNAFNPLSTAATMVSNAATAPPTIVSNAPPAASAPSPTLPANSFLNIPAIFFYKTRNFSRYATDCTPD